MARYLIFCTVFVALACVTKAKIQCPAPSKIEPCLCHQFCPNCPPVINCSNIESTSVLQEVFRKSGDTQFPSIIYSKVKIPFIPSVSLTTKRHIRLAVTDSTLESLFDQQPAESSLLQELFLNKVSLNGISWDLLSTLNSLRSLVISNVEIPVINDAFGLFVSKQIKSIHFSKTGTTRITKHAFVPLENLESLAIRSTRIQSLERDMFPKPMRVKILDFSDNKIRTLPDNFFSEMPDLGAILLSRNNITKFKESVFGDLPTHLKVISLRDNPLRCDCSMKWITERERMPYIEGHCADPDHLAGKRIRTLKSSDFEKCS